MKKKKICLVTNWYPTEFNPYQGLFFRDQAIALSEHYDFVVLHYQFSGVIFEKTPTIRLVKQEKNISEYTATLCLWTARNIFKRLLHHKIDNSDISILKVCNKLRHEDIDIFYSISGQTEAALTARLARYFNKPYVVSEHGPFPWVGTLVSEDNKKAIEGADLFMAISNDKIRQIMMQGLKLPKIWYVGNMVDDDKFKYVPSNNEVKTFVTVGANVFYKNYKMLIDTFNKLVEITDVPFRLIVVGYKANKGYSQDATELEQAFSNSKFSNLVELVPMVPHDEIPKVFNRADAFVMTSVQEGQPVSAIEAGCCGLPIFSTRCGGVEDYVIDRVGRIVGILESDLLADILKNFLEEDMTFDGETISKYIKGRFGKEAFINNMVEAFESLENK